MVSVHFTNVWGLSWDFWKAGEPEGRLPRCFFTDVPGTAVRISRQVRAAEFLIGKLRALRGSI